jgi:hypothetical protein
VLAEPAEVLGDGVLVLPEVRGYASDGGLGDESAAVIDARVQGDVLQHRPGHQPDRPLDGTAGREHLRGRFRAPDDATVGQDATGLLAEGDDVAGLPGRRPAWTECLRGRQTPSPSVAASPSGASGGLPEASGQQAGATVRCHELVTTPVHRGSLRADGAEKTQVSALDRRFRGAPKGGRSQ